MNITEALKKGNGKAWLQETGNFYVGEDNNGYLVWFVSNGNRLNIVNYERIIGTDWIPYSTGPEKCEACQEADEIMGSHDAMMVQVTER